MSVLGPMQDGKDMTAKEVILRAARMFRPLIHMRDDSFDTPIKMPRKPDLEWYDESIARAKEQLEKYSNPDWEALEKEAEESFLRRVKEYNDRIEKVGALKKKYEALLSQVEKWQPQNKEHEEVKKYAIEQIHSAIRWDCGTSYLHYPEKENPRETVEEMIKYAKSEIERQVERKKEDLERYEWATKWITDLQESVKGLE